MCCSPWGRKESDTTERLNLTELNWPYVCLIWRNVYLGLLPIFQLGYLCILEIKPLSVSSFANIFSKFIECLFVLFMVPFAVQRLVRLIRSHLFIFVFISIALGD